MSKATPEQLREAVTEMDSMAKSTFGEIAAIAKLALASLERPEAYIDLEGLARILSSIWGKALSAETCIGNYAQEVGCDYKDQAMLRRLDAQRKAHESAVGGRV